jgi:hypothetical protein
MNTCVVPKVKVELDITEETDSSSSLLGSLMTLLVQTKQQMLKMKRTEFMLSLSVMNFHYFKVRLGESLHCSPVTSVKHH